jgi:CRISPR system Cascade subunit CasA
LNLLNDQLLPVRMAEGRQALFDLPGLLALLGRAEIGGFLFLRPHQRHPWHAFCVQLAALALHRAGEADIRHPPERWRELLRGLTAEWPGDEPWQLVVADLGKPAFMQPPVPERTLADFNNAVETPDDLDVLVTSKNHGVKQGQMAGEEAIYWALALVCLQTTGVYYGQGK